jgi:sugar phosphate isomerase/epimerase
MLREFTRATPDMTHDRRAFLSSLGAAAVSLAYGCNPFNGSRPEPAERPKRTRLGIQLYTLRSVASANLGGTLAQLAAIGYTEIELAGFYNHSASEVRALLDQYGLSAPSAHIDIAQIEGAAADATFRDAKTIGLEWITVPSLPRGKRDTVDDWKRVAQEFNAVAKETRAAGFRFAYHNHNAEFQKVGTVVPLEILLAETDPMLVSFEMDVYWVVNGGGDPVDLLTRYPGRFKMLHLKDSMGAPAHKMADVGSGTIDFKAILAHAKGIEHYFVERDDPTDALASAKASYAYLSGVLSS